MGVQAQPLDPRTKTFVMDRPLRLAVRWMAPESAGAGPLTFGESTDMYSFGVLVWEIMAGGAMPFRAWDAATARAKIGQGTRPALPPNADAALYTLVAAQCWPRNPVARSTFKRTGSAVFFLLPAPVQVTEFRYL